MNHNFDLLLDRRHSDSVKWNLFPADVLPFWVADMDFISPPEVTEALLERARQPHYGYAGDNKELKQAIVKWLQDSFGWAVQEDWLMFLPGVVVGINNAAQALIEPGQSLAIQVPVYPPFLHVAELAGVKQTSMELIRDEAGHYVIDWEAFERSLAPGTGMVLICSPHNPVGRVWSRDELERISALCLERGIPVCSDEIHGDLVFPGVQHIPFGSLNEAAAMNSVTLMAPSKSFNIPGLCFSFAVVPNPEIRKKMAKARRGLVGGVNLMGEAAALAAYRHGRPWLNEVMAYIKANYDHVVDFIARELPGCRTTVAEGTYLMWIDCRALNIPADDLGKYVLERGRIALSDGAMFGQGGKGFLRMNIACPRSQLDEGLRRLVRALRG